MAGAPPCTRTDPKVTLSRRLFAAGRVPVFSCTQLLPSRYTRLCCASAPVNEHARMASTPANCLTCPKVDPPCDVALDLVALACVARAPSPAKSLCLPHCVVRRRPFDQFPNPTPAVAPVVRAIDRE